MLSALRKMLGHLWTVNHTNKRPLFSGSAYFSKCVPKAFTQTWVAHGGEISSGATLDVRARYFFAMDPSDPWVMKLFANSVVVIHAGWIVHCIEEAFIVPIAEYILDDKFIPEVPYKLDASASGIYVPLLERENHVSTEHGPISVQTSDTPSTPTSMPRKRRREQAYYDSPSGSLVFSAFDKDGLPRRPRKLRKLRFDPSFSPEDGKPDSETMQVSGLEDHWDSQLSNGYGQHANTRLLSTSHMTMVRMPDTPDKPLASKESKVPHRHFPTREHLQDTIRLSPPATSVDIQEKIPIASVRMIDFTNLPPPTRRRFPEAARITRSRDTGTLLSITRLTENEVKTPKKISFADHAQVCVYPVSPQRPDSSVFGPPQQVLEANVETRMSGKKVESYTEPTAVTKDMVPHPCSLPMDDDDPTRRPGGDQLENDTLMLRTEDVQAIRCRLLESATAKGVDDGQLATMFELGKTFRGMAFRHVW